MAGGIQSKEKTVKSMKIVYCIASIHNPGGKDRVVVSKANELAKLGWEVFIITTDQKATSSYFPLHPQIIHHDLDINYVDNNIPSLWQRWKIDRIKKKLHKQRLEKYLKLIKPDIVISTFEEDGSIIASIKLPFIKIMELHYSKERRYKEYVRSRFSPARLLDFLRTRYDEYIVSRYDYLVALTEVDMNKWWSAKNKCCIPNPLGWKLDASPVALINPKVIAVGRYSSEKNFEELIDIWATVSPAHPDWQLEIIGQGYLKDRLAERIDRLGIGHTTTLSPPTSRIQDEYQNASLLVMTSKYEGFGMVLIEAMSFGVPVVSYDAPYGPREIIHNGIDGFLVPLGNKQQFALRMGEVMSSIELRQDLGKNAFLTSKQYSSEKIIKQWVDLFEYLHRNIHKEYF